MALVLIDRAKETTNTTGTGTLTLAGAVSGFQSLAGVGDGNTTFYTIESGTDWEVGVGTYTSSGTTLSRDLVLSSSSGGSKITVASGAYVWVDYPAGRAVTTDNAVTLTNKTISGATNTIANIGNSSLTNSAITINGTSTSLGGSINVGTVTSVDMTVPTGLAVSGNPVTSSGTLAVTYASGYAIPTTAKQTEWDSAYTQRLQWDGGATNLVATTGRASLLPSYASNAGKVLAVNVGATDVEWVNPSSGTVTSVSGTGTVNGITLTGTVTSSGDLTLGGTLSGIGNSQLTNSSVTFNGQTVALGASGTITANTTNVLTIGTGLSGTSFNGSSAVTIANSGVLSNVAGTGISVSGATGNVTITNSAPDQTVVLTAGTGINTSGTYPNFTITNSSPDQTVALTGAGTTSISGTYPNFTITSNDQYSGTVTSITAGTGLTGGTITGSGTIAIDSTVATLTGSQTLTNKTLTSPTMIGTLIEDVFTITDGAGFAIDPNNGSIQLVTLGADRTPTVANFDAGEAVTMMIDDGTARTITWTTIGVVWVGGTAPTLATSGYTVIELWRVGSTYYGALVGEVA